MINCLIQFEGSVYVKFYVDRSNNYCHMVISRFFKMADVSHPGFPIFEILTASPDRRVNMRRHAKSRADE